MITKLLALPVLLRVAACAQPSAPSPIAAPLRELPWAQLNFLHTTDIHGWWGGHLQEPSYSADWGDYISFAKHLHDRADAEGSDLLLIDTGDRVEGNAIFDSSKPRGKFTYEIAKQQSIDLISSGNHELYKNASSEGEFYHTVPDFAGHYLASNLDIYNPETGNRQPLAPRFKKFTTKNQGIRILAFGFVFNFDGGSSNTVVQKVERTVTEDWFQKAIKDTDLDLVVVFGHVDIRSPEYKAVYGTIRNAQPDTPIQFFGGHSHIRDYKVFDDKSVALESGRYMETIGFMSIHGLGTGGTSKRAAVAQKPQLKFSRMYIDNNLYSLRRHSHQDKDSFPTSHGQNVSMQIDDARQSLGLSHLYGCAPQDLWVSRRPYPNDSSIFTWLEKHVLPDSISESDRFISGNKALVITNTGSIRFDIFKGPFTKDTTFLVSPFTSRLKYFKNVPYKAASQILHLLNSDGQIAEAMTRQNAHLQPPEVTAARLRPNMFSYPQDLDSQVARYKTHAQVAISADPEAVTPGYTTYDDLGYGGDDTIHSRIQFYDVPNCIQADVGFDGSAGGEIPETVDVVYNEFMQQFILMALHHVGEKTGPGDAEVYFEDDRSFTDVMARWVKGHWGRRC